MVKNKIIVLIFSLVIFSGCGFKVVKLSELNNFYINEIDTEGDKRVSYEIRNNLVSMTKNPEKKLINLKLNSNKTKTIKEKNIKNEITKYEVLIETNLNFVLIRNSENYDIKISSKGDYLVADNYSTTLSNEKKLVDDLIESISQKILDEIGLNLNDI